MRHINSINGINKQADANKPDSNMQDVSAQKSANSKLLQSLQSQSQSMRGAAQENSQIGTSKIKERSEYAKDFINSTKESQDSSDKSLSKTQESLDLMNSSFFKKTEARLLKEQAKTEPGEVGAELKRQAKEKLRESVTEEKDSRKAYNKSQEEDMNAFQFGMDASNSQDLSSNASTEATQAQAKAITYNNQANTASTEAAGLETQDASGGSPYSGGFLLGKDKSTGYKGFDQSRADDWKNGTGIFTPAGGVSEFTGNGSQNVNNNGVNGVNNANGVNGNNRVNNSDEAGGASGNNSNEFGADGLSVAGSSYLQAARALLRTIMQVTISAKSGNPIVQISKNLTNKSLADQAIAYLEAANVDTALNGTPTNQAIILTKAQASTISGESQTGINYWKQVLEDNKQLQKQTHDMAKAAG